MENNLRDGTKSVSFSGGKDSTYMVLRMHELGIKMNDIVYFDSGWDFPEMEDHIIRVEDFIKQKITRLVPQETFDFAFSKKERFPRDKSKPTVFGYGWPGVFSRWCNTRKVRAINAYSAAMTWSGKPLPIIRCIGFSSDEQKRVRRLKKAKKKIFQEFAYPLVDWGITGKKALEYCKERGFEWGGLYDVFDRVSCWCCPMGGQTMARKLYDHFPKLWDRMLEMESWLPEDHDGIKFTGKYRVSDLDKKFASETK